MLFRSPVLQMAVEKALEKDPAERYQSMRDLVVDLRRLTRQSVETASPPAARRRQDWKWSTQKAEDVRAGHYSMDVIIDLPSQKGYICCNPTLFGGNDGPLGPSRSQGKHPGFFYPRRSTAPLSRYLDAIRLTT